MRACLVFVVLTAATLARADNTTADDKFQAAQKLRDHGETKQACALFREALAQNRDAIGTILNVARCAAEEGKLGSAVRLFTDARDRAHEQGLDPQREAAEQHLAALRDRAPHLAVAFAEAPSRDTKLMI